ncbi:TerC family protein [Brevundimonas faecalis]|uniref:TerC family protein n=1 Tax=Brevundimonas faecalis TaxID=947378 RepID=UPI003619BC7D
MEWLLLDWMGKPAWMWAGFLALVVGLLALDLGVFNRRDHEIGVRESLALSAFYVAIALIFGAGVWAWLGANSAIEYLTAYAVEKSLAMDNVFVIALIFAAFSIPRRYQHRVLFWGVLGVIVLRAVMIGGGAALVERYDWVLYVFAGFLILTGIRMFFARDEETDIADNRLLLWLRRQMRVTPELHGHAFVVRAAGKSGRVGLHATPLLLALVAIEFADVIFAVDSVPAVFAITTDPYVVYTSNIFAILGLRALYFALAAVIHRFAYLKQALAVLLVFIGGKVFAAPLLGLEKIPPVVSLTATAAILGAGILWSLWRTRAEAGPPR